MHADAGLRGGHGVKPRHLTRGSMRRVGSWFGWLYFGPLGRLGSWFGFASWRLGEAVSSSFWHPCRGACREGGDGSGGVASLNHRLHSCIPPGCVRGSGPVCIAGRRKMVERGCRPGPLTRRTGPEASPPPREGTRPTEGGASHSAGTALPHDWGRTRGGGCRRHPSV